MKSPIALLCCTATCMLLLTTPPVGGQALVEMYQLTELHPILGGQSRAYAVNDIGQAVGWMSAGEAKHSGYWHNDTSTDLHGTVHFELEHPLFDQSHSEAYDISNGGQVVGTARTAVKCEQTFIVTHAFLVRPAVVTDLATPYPGDALTNLWTLGSVCAHAYDSVSTGMSNRNHVVGWADRVDGTIHAFLVEPQNGQFFLDVAAPEGVNDYMIDLGTLTGADPVSAATSVNDAGQVTGYSYTTSNGVASYHAFLLTPTDTDADGIGDRWFQDADGQLSVMASVDGVNILMQDLGTLGGINSWGRDINNSGQVVGESDVVGTSGDHYTHAFRWAAGQITDLGTLRSDPTQGFSSAAAINDQGVIVGWSENDDGERRAYIYHNGVMEDLNDLLYLLDDQGTTVLPGIVLTEARDINADGVIVGWGTIRGSTSGETRGFLLTPVLVDPSTVPEVDLDSTTGTSSTSTDTDTIDTPIFGTPGHLYGTDTAGDSTSGGTSGGGLPALCGFGSVTFVPLTLLALGWLRFAQRRK